MSKRRKIKDKDALVPVYNINALDLDKLAKTLKDANTHFSSSELETCIYILSNVKNLSVRQKMNVKSFIKKATKILIARGNK
ncbi:MAG: hypothetical protein IJ593_00300 [Lachnospiraceae bacterium]|nr:hypothetical protein [Lachnospiraceae bacterium]